MLVSITPELIIEPAFAKAEDIDKSIENLIMIQSIIRNGNPLNITKHPELLERLCEHGLYPSKAAYSKNLIGSDSFSANDIARIASNILDSLNTIDDIDFIIEGDISCTPSIESNLSTNKALSDLLLVSLISTVKNSKVVCTGYKSHLNTFSGKADKIIYRENEEGKADYEIINYQYNTLCASDIEQILLAFGSDYLYKKSSSKENYKMAVFSRALEINYNSGGKSRIKLSDFQFGDSFLVSLSRNNCWVEQRFGSCCFETVARIIADSPKYEIKEFRTSVKQSSSQVISGNYKAFRSHITKSAVAIRLMLWKDHNGYIQFANVGTKDELVIADVSD
ncbi:hypothetical protein [Shewanella xiamenensis]|uniref:hypothetical protein n=1 Tax=Shewanella xiamenensis TaxID=332186 RepID=UPI00155902BD|nr:hypothetical protein [Shewanella xiamenensis]